MLLATLPGYEDLVCSNARTRLCVFGILHSDVNEGWNMLERKVVVSPFAQNSAC